MFNHFPDKQLVKEKSQQLWKEYRASGTRAGAMSSQDLGNPSRVSKPVINVSDQFPKSVQDRRKILLPVMIKAKHDGKNAFLSYDKLYIDGKMFSADTVANAGYN